MTYSDKKKILDYVFENNDIPAYIMNEFSKWLIENEGDTETEAIMLEKWDRHSAAIFEENDLKGLQAIKSTINHRQKKRKIKTTMLRSACALTLAAAIFSIGYLTAGKLNTPVKEITLVTSEGDIGEFTLPDGTKVWLNENSRLTYPETFDKDKRHVSLIGEGFFEVRKNADAPFSLSMQNMCIEVLGTSFGASCYVGDPYEEIVLKSGSVKVSGATISDAITLKPNEQLTYSPFNGSVNVSDIDAANSYRWYEKYLTFDNARFEDILSNIGHRYRVEIKSLSSVSKDIRLSITIINESLETIMDIISALLPIKYEIIDDCLIIKDKH